MGDDTGDRESYLLYIDWLSDGSVGMEGENYFTRIDGLIDNSEGSMNLSQGRTLGRVVCLIELNRPV